MARYRKVSILIWNDDKFRRLPDDSKLLFLFLLTHPHMTSLGGMRATKPGIGSELGWKPERTAKAFNEPLSKGMVWIDESAACLILPNFIKHNPPENPNVVTSWGSMFDQIPECQIRLNLLRIILSYGESLEDKMLEAFERVSARLSNLVATPFPFPEPFPEPSLSVIAPEPPVEKLGKFKNVILSPDERLKLEADFGVVGTSDRIEALSEYMASKRKKYSSHYATILTWERKNGAVPIKSNGNGSRLKDISRLIQEPHPVHQCGYCDVPHAWECENFAAPVSCGSPHESACPNFAARFAR